MRGSDFRQKLLEATHSGHSMVSLPTLWSDTERQKTASRLRESGKSVLSNGATRKVHWTAAAHIWIVARNATTRSEANRCACIGSKAVKTAERWSISSVSCEVPDRLATDYETGCGECSRQPALDFCKTSCYQGTLQHNLRSRGA